MGPVSREELKQLADRTTGADDLGQRLICVSVCSILGATDDGVEQELIDHLVAFAEWMIRRGARPEQWEGCEEESR